jgi:uncharacterized OB-fold protein
MNLGLKIWFCRDCGHAYFPERLICAECGGAEFDAGASERGEVEDITVINHVIGQENWTPRPIATIRLDEGPRILAGAIGEIAIGDAVSVQSDDLVPYVARQARG